MTLAAFLIGMVGPLAARILTSLGLSLMSVAGLTVAVSTLRGYIMDSVGGLPLDGLQLAGLFGIWQSLGLVLGSITFCVTWASTAGFWRLVKT